MSSYTESMVVTAICERAGFQNGTESSNTDMAMIASQRERERISLLKTGISTATGSVERGVTTTVTDNGENGVTTMVTDNGENGVTTMVTDNGGNAVTTMVTYNGENAVTTMVTDKPKGMTPRVTAKDHPAVGAPISKLRMAGSSAVASSSARSGFARLEWTVVTRLPFAQVRGLD